MKRRGHGDKRNRAIELEMEEYNEIASYLDEYAVDFPSEMEIDRMIRALDAHMPDPASVRPKPSYGRRMRELFQLVRGRSRFFTNHTGWFVPCSCCSDFGWEHTVKSILT